MIILKNLNNCKIAVLFLFPRVSLYICYGFPLLFILVFHVVPIYNNNNEKIHRLALCQTDQGS